VTYPIYVVDRGTLDRVFPAGDVRVPLSLVVDAKRRVIDVFSGWTVEAQRHMARLK